MVAEDRPTLELLTDRRPGQQASYLFFGAAHYLLLTGVRHPLRDFHPSLVGSSAADPADAGPVLRDFCRRYRAELGELVRTRLVADPRGELAMHGPDGVPVPLLRVDGHLRWLGPLEASP